MKITVVGAGYVGLSLSVLLSRTHEVTVVDILDAKVNAINKRISPLKDSLIDHYFANEKLNLKATLNLEDAVKHSELVIIATPTDLDEKTNTFNTRSVDETINTTLKQNPTATILIKSTLPIGHTQKLNELYGIGHIIFSPEFLKEGTAIYDTLHPSRIIVSGNNEHAQKVAKLLLEISDEKDVKVLFMPSREAEATKLFANAYLAMRVAFFNELDTYSELNDLDAKSIIEGVSLDPRVGDYYNNPSFGYGGYCLPKDTKQLLSNFNNVPSSLIQAIIESNEKRKDHIAESILKRSPKVVGFYRLVTKKDSDNTKSSIMKDIIDRLRQNDIKVIVYEPLLKHVGEVELINDFNKFASKADIIVANRVDKKLIPYKDKVYTRDIYHIN